MPSHRLAWPAPAAERALLEPGHGLIVQSYAPRRQAHGRMNADGFPDHHLVDVADGVVTVTELEA